MVLGKWNFVLIDVEPAADRCGSGIGAAAWSAGARHSAAVARACDGDRGDIVAVENTAPDSCGERV